MTTVAGSEDTFNRSAGRQLLLFAAISIGSIGLLMYALAWASSLTGSGAGSEVAVDPETRTVTLFLREEPPQLNSSLATDMVSGMVLGHVMEGLLRYDEHNRLVPGMAERWEIDANGAIFHLRSDAVWSDGAPVTAHDFVFAWQLALDPANASQYAFILYPVKNGRAIAEAKLPVSQLGARAVDDRTLEVTFERPVAYFDKLVAFPTYYPIRRDFYEATKGRYGADAHTLLYNGPFRMTRWVHGAHVRLEKNPTYWDEERIRIEVLDFPYITSDANATLNLFKDNKVAYAGLLAENLNDAMEQRWHIKRFMDGSVFFIEFNFRDGRVTANTNLRKAMQHAVDPAELVYKVTKLPGYIPGESLFPVWLRGVNGYFRQEYPAPKTIKDVVKAREYLQAAKRELGMEQIPPLVLLSGDNPVSNIQSEYFQQVFKQTLGLDIRIDKQIFKQRLAKMTSGDFDMVLAGWGPDYDDPLTFGDLFASWNLNNRGRYSNPELDRQVAIAEESLDPKTRMDAFGEIQRILHDDVVILINYEPGTTYVVNPDLGGLVRRSVGPDPDFTNAYIVEG
ncbi:MAG TPA: peptide ABC transporter substrate-binding protein [Pseudomonadales bacterium]